ncbi:MAG: 30S ribosomal protein S21, partial [Elusimicrobiaceae bacterium]|nr:30S ribosomal protein S21 [Elusimicrobiaceae bacterium]
RETYMPPSVKRKIKSQEAQRRARRTKRRRY